jgi:hypothetical protein
LRDALHGGTVGVERHRTADLVDGDVKVCVRGSKINSQRAAAKREEFARAGSLEI